MSILAIWLEFKMQKWQVLKRLIKTWNTSVCGCCKEVRCNKDIPNVKKIMSKLTKGNECEIEHIDHHGRKDHCASVSLTYFNINKWMDF